MKDRQICLAQFKPVLNFFYQLELEFLIQVLIIADIDFPAGIVQFELAQLQHISLVVIQNGLNRTLIAFLRVQNGIHRDTAYHGAVQERHALAPGAGIAGAEQGIGLAVGDAQLLGPLHGVEVIGVGGHVNEGAGLPRLGEGRLDLHLTAGHGEGVLAIALVGELQLIALAVQYGDGADLVAAVGLDGDGHPVALGGVLGRNGHIAVLGAGDGHRVAAATGRRTTARRTAVNGQRSLGNIDYCGTRDGLAILSCLPIDVSVKSNRA